MLLYDYIIIDEVADRVTKLKDEVVEQQTRAQEAALEMARIEAERQALLKEEAELRERTARREEAERMVAEAAARLETKCREDADKAARAQRQAEQLKAEREERKRLREERLIQERREREYHAAQRQERAEKRKEQAQRRQERQQMIRMAKRAGMDGGDLPENLMERNAEGMEVFTAEEIQMKERRKELWMRAQEACAQQDLDTLEWVFYELDSLDGRGA